MIYMVIFVLLTIFAWMSYEFRRAPFMDKEGNIIKKDKDDTRTS
jgi:hypothetical protein